MKPRFKSLAAAAALVLGTTGFAGEITFRFVNPSKADCNLSWFALQETWVTTQVKVSVAESGILDPAPGEAADGRGLRVPAGHAATFRIQHPDDGQWTTSARFEAENASAASAGEDLIPCGFDYSLKVDALGIAGHAFGRSGGLWGIHTWDADVHEAVYDGEAIEFTEPALVAFVEEPVEEPAAPGPDSSKA